MNRGVGDDCDLTRKIGGTQRFAETIQNPVSHPDGISALAKADG
jgi:hypothetical protein